jgi:hypothetical protein
MTTQQLYLSIGIPSVLILLALVINQVGFFYLSTQISNLRSELATELRAIRSDINMLKR